MPPLWTCPDEDCLPTELAPRPDADEASAVELSVCAGCGQRYPSQSYKLVP
jgi:hypothetical protein